MRHCPKRPGGKANILRRRPLARVNECIKTVRDPSRSRGRGGCGGCVCVCVCGRWRRTLRRREDSSVLAPSPTSRHST